jgi:hypothetical protein
MHACVSFLCMEIARGGAGALRECVSDVFYFVISNICARYLSR